LVVAVVVDTKGTVQHVVLPESRRPKLWWEEAPFGKVQLERKLMDATVA